MKAAISFAAAVGTAFLLYRRRREGVDHGAAVGDGAVDGGVGADGTAAEHRHIIINMQTGTVSGPAYCAQFCITIRSLADGTLYYNDICKSITDHIHRNPT